MNRATKSRLARPDSITHRTELAPSRPDLPFLKWPGGKRWLASVIARVVRRHLSGRYYEPFLGGGAVFFHLKPSRATLSDINSDLINTYAAIRDSYHAVIAFLQMLPVSKRVYLEVRSWKPTSRLERATRFLYLNRTAFGGIYRLNRDGEFNVPFGGGKRTPAILWQGNLVEAAAAALRGATLLAADFSLVMRQAREGDVVYCDPTYTVAHENNGFLRYNERNFSWLDQQRLASAAQKARLRGATVIISNAHHKSVRSLYSGATITRIQRVSCVSASAKYRRKVCEYLIVLKP